ncbi:PREDICTED: insulin-like peptide isoform X2 [Branchiostoma belcheri]|uniref:Insulin-like peptide isoform X2 n=1 Tax=Branchiostoma belcheri TaxID=7741 RepID=A0A6P4YZR6_BRABE|nr:PREDICTED: insulin-like peptide isoform X2 [Branchiostoma belcheri]
MLNANALVTPTSLSQKATGMNLSSVYVLASLAVVCLLVKETRAEYLCGSTLADVLSFVCGNRGYNSQPRRSLGKRAIDFISEQQAKDYMGSMPPVRRRRGLVEECCLNVCDYSHLESYCNPHPTAPATASPVRTTESQPEEQERDEELAPLDGMVGDQAPLGSIENIENLVYHYDRDDITVDAAKKEPKMKLKEILGSFEDKKANPVFPFIRQSTKNQNVKPNKFPDSSAHQYPTDLVEEGPTNEIPETPSQKPTLERLGYKDNQTDKKEPAENNNNNRARDNRTKSSTVEPHTVPDYISKQYTHKPLITLPRGTPRRIDAPGQLSLN